MNWTLVAVFALTFQAMLVNHISRESFAMVISTQLKIQFKEDAGFSSWMLGVLDTAFFLTYAIGLFISGFIEDKLDPKKVVCCGLATSAITLLFFSAMGSAGITQAWAYFPLFLINGFCQSTVFPGTTAIMGKFFTDESVRGKVFAVWGGCVCTGNILGAVMTAFMQETLGASWQRILLVVAVILASSAASLLFLLPSARVTIIESAARSDSDDETVHPKGNCCQALLLPGYFPLSVLLYAGCYGFQKMTYQGLTMWIPFFFEERFNDTEELAGALETLYEVGGLLGGIAMGVICDWTGYRASVVTVVLWLMLPVLYVFTLPTPGATWFYFIIVFCAGFGTSGAANFLSSVIPVDLAQSNPHAGEVLATIVGFIDGCGSLGAALGEVVVTFTQIGSLSERSWNDVFTFIMSILACSTLFLIPRIISENLKDHSPAREIELSKQ